MSRLAAQRVADALGILVAGIGTLVLIGWAFDIAWLKAVNSVSVTVKPNTAVGLCLAGLSLVFIRRTKVLRVVAIVACAVVLLVAFLSLAEYIWHVNLGIDEALFADDPGAAETTHPGRMSPSTAILLMAVSVAIAGLGQRSSARLAGLVWPLSLGYALLPILGFIFGAHTFAGIPGLTPMALPTAVAFALLGAGIFAAAAPTRLLEAMTPSTPGGFLMRRLLVPSIVATIVFAWLRLQGERAGLYGSGFGIALTTALTVGLISALAIWCATVLNRVDAERKAVAEERDRYFRSSLDLLCVADTNGYFIQANPVWERTLGYTLDEIKSRPYMEFIHPEDRDATLKAAAQLADGRDVVSFENRYRRKDGSYAWLNWSATPTKSGAFQVYAAARDITEKKHFEERRAALTVALERAIEETRTANKELEAFSYSVSHDLRSPLRAIDGFSRILVEEHAEDLDSEGRRLLGIVRENTQRMGNLIDDLLKFSRLGRKELDSCRVDMDALVHKIADRLRPEIADRNVVLRIDPLPPVAGDPSLLEVVWTNLLSNAVKYTRARPHSVIEVTGRQEDSRLVYCVKDNGVGFDMQYADKLFGVFQRLHSPQEFEGTGVGLALVQRIVHRHGGRVWAEAKPDEGAAFHFELPAAGGVYAR